MSDAENQNSLPPASPTTAQPEQSPAVPAPALTANPRLLTAALGRKIGRPTIKSEESIRKILIGIRTKRTLGGAAAYAGIGKRTLDRWKRNDAEFAELIEMAQAVQVERLVKEMLDYAKNGKHEGRDWRAISWLLERLAGANRDLRKHNPDVVTPDVLAAKIGEIVARVIPLIDESKHAAAQAILDDICGSLKPKDGSDDDGS